LTLIGGIFGIVIVPIILIGLGVFLAIGSVFTPGAAVSAEELGEMTAASIAISILVSIIAIVIVFTIKNHKVLAGILISLGIISLIATNISGVVTWILLIVAGIVVAKDSGQQNVKQGRDAEILRERYAKGEISKEEFESMKQDLGFGYQKIVEGNDFYRCEECNFEAATRTEMRRHSDDKRHKGYIAYKLD